MKVTLYILGGKVGREALTELGASCYLLVIEVHGKTYCYLIDCGMETKDDAAVTYAAARDLHLLQNFLIDDIFLTHAHRDHAAALAMKAVLPRLKPDARLFATRTSAAFLPFVLHDQNKVSGRRNEKLPYGQLEIYNLMKRVKRINEPGVIELVPETVWALVWPSGHIRGACSFIFRIREGEKEVKIMFSGDYSCHNQLTTAAAPLPPDNWYPDIIASFDCTNGAEDLTQGTDEATFWQREMERMADDGHRTVKSGGRVFYWAFSMDRAPTFARKLVDLGLPVWLDGPSAIELTRRLALPEGSWCDRDLMLDIRSVRIADYTFQPLDDPNPCAIVAPGGMGHGPAVKYFAQLLTQETALVGSSGYQAHGTNGWRVVNAKRGDRVRLETDSEEGPVEVTVAARVKKYRPSAHSFRRMAAERIEQLLSRSQLRRSGVPILGLCHGSTPALDQFESHFNGLVTFRPDRREDRKIVLVE